MKITCSKQKLNDAVLNVQRAVSTKTSVSALEGIFIKTGDSFIKLCGYDLALGITTDIEAEVSEEGSIVLNAKLLGDIVHKLPAETVTISTNEKLLTTITSGEAEFSIVGIRPDEYPELPIVKEHMSFKISNLLLKSMIHQTIFSISESDAKPIHTGTLFEIEKDKIRLVSVDGYRLAIREEPLNCGIEGSFVVPGKTLKEVIKLIGENEEEISIIIGERHILFSIENYTVISRLLEGEFLDYRAAVPKESITEVTVPVNRLIESVERVSLIVTERLKSPIRCNFNENEIKISCASSIGRATDQIKAKIEGSAVEIGFNNLYLLDALRNTECDEVKILLNGPLNPTRIIPIEGKSFLFLVLPVRLNNNFE